MQPEAGCGCCYNFMLVDLLYLWLCSVNSQMLCCTSPPRCKEHMSTCPAAFMIGCRITALRRLCCKLYSLMDGAQLYCSMGWAQQQAPAPGRTGTLQSLMAGASTALQRPCCQRYSLMDGGQLTVCRSRRCSALHRSRVQTIIQ